MDWLNRIPLVGALYARLRRTHGWHAYETLDRVRWTRLAAAITFSSFVAIFPLITVAAAIGAALLSTDQLERLQSTVTEQMPGISDQIDLRGLVSNAGTVGGVAAALLLLAGIGWVGELRGCLRVVWGLDDAGEENPVVRKGLDALILIGLGGAFLASVLASMLATMAIDRSTDLLGIDRGGASGLLLRLAGFAVAVSASFLVVLYVLTLLPGVKPARRPLLVAGLMGAGGFELLKLLLGGYFQGVAGKSMYGAFGVPVALLLWMNFTAKLLLFCAAWTATRTGEQVGEQPGETDGESNEESGAESGEGAGPTVAVVAPQGAAPVVGGGR